MRLVVPTLVLSSLLAAACGGGGGESAQPTTPATPVPPLPIQELQAPSIPLLNGSVESSGSSSTNGAPGVGDNGVDNGVRGHVVYDLASLPAGATIVSAIMKIDLVGAQGAPFPSFGAVEVDHVSALSYADDVLSLDVGTLASDGTVGPRTLDVTSQVAADVAAARTTSQFRLRFGTLETDSDGSLDIARFDSDSLLEIRYQ